MKGQTDRNDFSLRTYPFQGGVAGGTQAASGLKWLHSEQNQPTAFLDAEPGNLHSVRYISTVQYVQRVRGRVGGFAMLRADYPLLIRASYP